MLLQRIFCTIHLFYILKDYVLNVGQINKKKKKVHLFVYTKTYQRYVTPFCVDFLIKT
jgi:hypothetical protein